MDHFERLTPETHANYLALLNAQKVVLELSAVNKRAGSKLAVCMFTVYERHLDQKIQATAAGQIFFISVKECAHDFCFWPFSRKEVLRI
jgi:hypothetical protein